MRIISYLRVSTVKQGISGLGLEAQRAAVTAFAASGAHQVVTQYVEVESGAKSSRPQLTAALAACKLHRATLVIAKLDRLARNVAFIANLMDGGVEFVACDMPHANRLTLHLLAAIAEHEREMISQRTKAALQAVKARGVKLGNPNGAAALRPYAADAGRRSGELRRARAQQNAVAIGEVLREMMGESALSLRGMAPELNRRGIPSPSGKAWYGEQVRRTLVRVEA